MKKKKQQILIINYAFHGTVIAGTFVRKKLISTAKSPSNQKAMSLSPTFRRSEEGWVDGAKAVTPFTSKVSPRQPPTPSQKFMQSLTIKTH